MKYLLEGVLSASLAPAHEAKGRDSDDEQDHDTRAGHGHVERGVSRTQRVRIQANAVVSRWRLYIVVLYTNIA